MVRIDFQLEAETSESQYKSGRYNPNEDIIVHYHNSEYRLLSGHGTNDCIECFRQGTLVYVLSMNTRMDYVGLAVYDLSDRNEQREPLTWYSGIFLQNDFEIDDILGAKGLDLADTTILRRLLPYVE
jgi:hypothetical protein